MATHAISQRLNHSRVTLNEHLPVDHRLNRVYRFGAGLMGLVLLVFGILGLIHQIGFFDTGGDTSRRAQHQRRAERAVHRRRSAAPVRDGQGRQLRLDPQHRARRRCS